MKRKNAFYSLTAVLTTLIAVGCMEAATPEDEEQELGTTEGRLDCVDADYDYVCDAYDNCPSKANPYQEDADYDKVGDVCDNCKDKPNPYQEDADYDKVGDVCDNCKDKPNPYQEDADYDKVGDVCDNCKDKPNPYQEDADYDKVGDVCDNCKDKPNSYQEDADYDKVGDVCDNCVYVANPAQKDADYDGMGNACEYDCTGDSDYDGVCDNVDECKYSTYDDATEGLNPNHSIWEGGASFTVGESKSPKLSFTMKDTAGCSCTQIIQELSLGAGHKKHGCSPSAMKDWIQSVY
ncbi:thrombospondin type 3 repeat-containing protein [Polyangium jinanense]|uniref:thrombospondin type 3 repeat-containing protein n=1 Tax=Polyangium jinanense TaxID=2829994 RepID=UPI00234223A2|nr:thrombospondin type 3 repeat-containing protein [Polyangium jinanense]MDC3954410.1 thrombospondin type 3 repeat-containing protein [Polyangium jinanense]